jgi:hypothetical protein
MSTEPPMNERNILKLAQWNFDADTGETRARVIKKPQRPTDKTL